MNISIIGNTYSKDYSVKNKTTAISDNRNDFANILSSQEILHNKIEEMQENIEAGNVDFEPVFQIGGKAYTQEEWEKLLEYVDEVEEETQKNMEAEQAMIEATEKNPNDK